MSDEKIAPVTPRIGDTLREAREARELSLADISGELLVREEYLKSIEDMYAGGVPKGYLNGLLRTYANFLGLSAETVIQDFAEQCGAVSQAPKREAVMESNVRTQSVARAAFAGFAAAAVIVLVGGVGWHLLSPEPAVDATLIEAGAPVNGARTSMFASAQLDRAQPQLPLTLTATEAAWLEVRGADGTIFRSRRMAAGEVYHPRIGAGWTVSARNGAAFTWHVGDVEIGPLGTDTNAIYAMSVDSVAAEAQARTSPALAAIGDAKPSR